MYFDTYAAWEHSPKTLKYNEVLNPLTVIEDFFSADSVKGHKRDLKEWRTFVTTDKHFVGDRHGPGGLLFTYDLNLKLLEALYLLLVDHQNNGWQDKEINDTQIKKEREEWPYYPENLSLKEQTDPYRVIKKAFKKISPQKYRDCLHEWVHFALYNHPADESLLAGELILVYENLLKLYGAAWLIFQRESKFSRVKKERSVEQQPDLTQIEIKAINPDPAPAEKLGLEAVKDLILKRIPSVKMIVHLGTHPEPFTFYLLVLIGDEEKTLEHEVSNKIEDNCRYLANVLVLVHKEGSVKTGLNTGSRFWNMAMAKGNIIYQATELALPLPEPITEENIISSAIFHWERWGKQGKEFLEGAERYMANSNYRLAAFLLHQAAESVLKAIIQAVIGYKISIHNLSRMLRITLLFTDELKNIFKPDSAEGERLFHFLQSAYSESRYRGDYNPDWESVKLLYKRVGDLIDAAELIYLKSIEN